MAVALANRPAWLQAILDDYQGEVANVFLLHGNVFDYAEHPERDLVLTDYLGVTLAPKFTVAQYSPDQGITFAGPPSVASEARRRVERVMGLAEQQAAPDPFNPGRSQAADQGVQLPPPGYPPIPFLVDFLRTADQRLDARDQPVEGEDGKLACVIVERLDLICPPADKAMLDGGKAALLSLLHRVGTSPDLVEKGGLLILLAPSLEEVHPDLRLASSGIRAIEIPPPDFEQRRAFCERIVRSKDLELEVSINELAAQTAGLGRRHIEDLALRAENGDGRITRELIKVRKGEMIRAEYAEVLEVLEPNVTMDLVGGHELAKGWLLKYLVGPMTDDDLRDLCPMGAMLAGPPGTGKTWLARAVATETGANCVLLRGDKIKGGIVGESERRLAKALVGIKALAPCVVFMDEIDQNGGRRNTSGAGDGGSAVEGGQFGRLLEFFGDTSHRGEIVLISATNRPDLVDGAFKREGRTDAIIPLLPPDSSEERADVLAVLLRRHMGVTETLDAVSQIARDTDDWTPAELEGLVVKAKAIGKIEKMDIGQALLEAKRWTKNAESEMNRFMARVALAECRDLRLVPERYRGQVGKSVPDAERPIEADRDEPAPVGRARRGGGRQLDI